MTFNELAAANPCIRFIVDNYDMLCAAHWGKVVMALGASSNEFGPEAYIAKTFDSMIEAMMYTEAIDMSAVPYALKLCDGSEISHELLFSKACKAIN